MTTVPPQIEELADILGDVAETLPADESTDFPWTVEVMGYVSIGVFQAQLDEDDTFSLWRRSWDRTGGLSYEDEIAHTLTPTQVAEKINDILAKERRTLAELEALNPEEDERTWLDG